MKETNAFQHKSLIKLWNTFFTETINFCMQNCIK